MALHLHISNLRDDATNQDIRQLFSGLSILHDGVTIVGGPDGEAFVTFDSELDLIQAVKRDGEQHLKFTVATDVERLQGVNRMCLRNMERIKQETSPSNTLRHSDDDAYKTRYARCDDTTYHRVPFQSENSNKKLKTIQDDDHYDVGNKAEVSDTQWIPPKKLSTLNLHSNASNPSFYMNSFNPNQGKISKWINPSTSAKPVVQPHKVLPKVSKSVDLQRKLKCPFDSLLTTLLPDYENEVYCLQVIDMPAEVTPRMVWSWVGGPEGTATGVILLKPTHDVPIAFLIYADETERNHSFDLSSRTVQKFSSNATCHFIAKFIRNWARSKPQYKISTVFETFSSKGNLFIAPRVLYSFCKKVPKVKIPPMAKQLSYEKPQKKTKVYMGLYRLHPSITGAEILSWFSHGINVLKCDFTDSSGPNYSDSVAFVLFENDEVYGNALIEIHGKEVVTERLNTEGIYTLISKYESCTITESTSSGERIISEPERKQSPFISAPQMRPQFSFLNTMKYLHLIGVPTDSTTSVIWSWYPKAVGVAVMKNLHVFLNQTDAIVGFDKPCQLGEAIEQGNINSGKWTAQQKLNTKNSVGVFSRSDFQITISTQPNQPDRYISVEEVKYIMQRKRIKADKSGDLQQSTSFLQHVKYQNDSTDEYPFYLKLNQMQKKFTACELHDFFPDAVCALKVNAIDEQSATGYILSSCAEDREAARLLFASSTLNWSCLPINKQIKNPVLQYKRVNVENQLARACGKSTVSESTPTGIDKLISTKELCLKVTNSPFSLLHNNSSVQYAKLTDFNTYLSAGEIWDHFGERTGKVKAVILLTNNKKVKRFTALIAFGSTVNLQDVTKGVNHFIKRCPVVSRMTEEQTLDFLQSRTNDSDIKISTETGPDRELDADEEKLCHSMEPQKAPKNDTIIDSTSEKLTTDLDKETTSVVGVSDDGDAVNICSAEKCAEISLNEKDFEVPRDLHVQYMKDSVMVHLKEHPSEGASEMIQDEGAEMNYNEHIDMTCDEGTEATFDGGIEIISDRHELESKYSDFTGDGSAKMIVEGNPELKTYQEAYPENHPLLIHGDNDHEIVMEEDDHEMIDGDDSHEVINQADDCELITENDIKLFEEDKNEVINADGSDVINDVYIEVISNECDTHVTCEPQVICEEDEPQYQDSELIHGAECELKCAEGHSEGHYSQDDTEVTCKNTKSSEDLCDKESKMICDDKHEVNFPETRQGNKVSDIVQSSNALKNGYFIRFKKVHENLRTASEILSLYSSKSINCCSATIVRDYYGDPVSGYVMFDHLSDRDSALEIVQSSVKCSAYGRAVRLSEFNQEFEILESTTDKGPDRLMTDEERESLENQFN